MTPTTIEFVEDAPPPQSPRPPRRRRWPLVLVAAVLVVAGGVAIVRNAPGTSRPVAVRPQPSRPAVDGESLPPDVAPIVVTDAQIYRWATGDLITAAQLAGQCASLPADTPLRTLRALTHVLPAWRVPDSSTVTSHGRTCAVQLRALDTRGDRVLVFLGPNVGNEDEGLGVHAGSYGRYRVETVQFTWGATTVLAASVGRAGVPPTSRLVDLVTSPSLLPRAVAERYSGLHPLVR